MTSLSTGSRSRRLNNIQSWRNVQSGPADALQSRPRQAFCDQGRLKRSPWEAKGYTFFMCKERFLAQRCACNVINGSLERNKRTNLTYLTMKNKCSALLDNTIVTSNLPLNFDIFQKITKIDINFNTVVGIEEKELTDFSKFIQTNSKNMQKPIKITRV